jgi:hypothetical protein
MIVRSVGDAVAFPYLTPKKEKELWILASSTSPSVVDFIYHTLSDYLRSENISAYSYAILFPTLSKEDNSEPSFPVYPTKLVDKRPIYGDPASAASHILKCKLPLCAIEWEQGELPLWVRIIDRGDPLSPRSDISAMELFGSPNVNSDPFVLATRLKKQQINDVRQEKEL